MQSEDLHYRQQSCVEMLMTDALSNTNTFLCRFLLHVERKLFWSRTVLPLALLAELFRYIFLDISNWLFFFFFLL